MDHLGKLKLTKLNEIIVNSNNSTRSKEQEEENSLWIWVVIIAALWIMGFAAIFQKISVMMERKESCDQEAYTLLACDTNRLTMNMIDMEENDNCDRDDQLNNALKENCIEPI